jgi:hypothetical protein
VPPGEANELAGRVAELVDLIADAVADRVVACLAERPPPAAAVTPASGRIDTKTLARELGVSPSFVYEHADELGAERLGPGRRARLRFDLEGARAAMARARSRRSEVDAEPGSIPQAAPPPPRKRRPTKPAPAKSTAETRVLTALGLADDPPIDPNVVLPIRRPAPTRRAPRK